MERPGVPHCPHCGSHNTGRHGTFARTDGTRQPRRLCRACGRTFSPNTGTPMYYIKKRRQWAQLARAMARRLSIRRLAAALGVRPATAFRWRHRLLGGLSRAPQPSLTGSAAACETYVPYSEKGSRSTDGPGAWGRRRTPAVRRPGVRPFRRFLDGKPSCVLLACTREQHLLTIVSRGRPQPAALHASLAPVVSSVTHLWGRGFAPYADTCRRLGVPYQDASVPLVATPPAVREVDLLHCQFRTWLRRFHGVATRYLAHYLAWFAVTRRVSRIQQAA